MKGHFKSMLMTWCISTRNCKFIWPYNRVIYLWICSLYDVIVCNIFIWEQSILLIKCQLIKCQLFWKRKSSGHKQWCSLHLHHDHLLPLIRPKFERKNVVAGTLGLQSYSWVCMMVVTALQYTEDRHVCVCALAYQ